MRQIRKELGKLINYAKGHGIDVYIRDDDSSANSGEWVLKSDKIEIIIYEKKPILQYLTLLHELAHHKQFVIDKRVVPSKTRKAYEKEAELLADEFLAKEYRYIIYQSEVNDSKHQFDILKDTNSSIPVWRVKLEIAVDLFTYKRYYQTGSFPLVKEIVAKRKELRKRYAKRLK